MLDLFVFAFVGFVVLVVLLLAVLRLRGWRVEKGGSPGRGSGGSDSSMSGWGG